MLFSITFVVQVGLIRFLDRQMQCDRTSAFSFLFNWLKQFRQLSRHSPSSIFSRSSVSIEETFWNGMKEISGQRSMTLSELVGEIDTNRHQGNLSSAIRLFVLDHFRTRSPGFDRGVPGAHQPQSANVAGAMRHSAGRNRADPSPSS
jgi:predicted DNA-binding ribbon-helix-helix protein